jgi:hypothetical protein
MGGAAAPPCRKFKAASGNGGRFFMIKKSRHGSEMGGFSRQTVGDDVRSL